jgi:EAL domain-containing protein (putative c-di-GMP-specific phosphodiesterase class I)
VRVDQRGWRGIHHHQLGISRLGDNPHWSFTEGCYRRGREGGTITDVTVQTHPKRRLADDLRAAMDAREIELRFQPQAAVADGRIIGVEVLARWRHHRLGELGAERLFAAAARAALLPVLSRHIQATALVAVAAWPSALSHLRVAINVTAGDLARSDFAEGFLSQMAALSIDPHRLTLEITEHDLIANLDAAAAVLRDLQALGIRVALDDFGTGYSGIAYLKALPLDYLKIDSRLAADIVGSPRDQVVVRHVIAMARELELAVIAEGVETEAHLAALAEAGCASYQGYLCAEPLTGTEIVRLVENRG